MPGYQKSAPIYRMDVSEVPEYDRIYRAIDSSREFYYEFHTYTSTGAVSLLDRKVMTQRGIELILDHGGEIREDRRASSSMVLYTMPPGVPNPIREDDPRWRGKIVTRLCPPWTRQERLIFGIDQQ